jgi:hypothetical protein
LLGSVVHGEKVKTGATMCNQEKTAEPELQQMTALQGARLYFECQVCSSK